MTNQEAFDGIMKWLTRPNAERCAKRNPEGSSICVYYDPETENRCAIGGHLPLEIAKELGDVAFGIQGLLTNDKSELRDIPRLNLDLVPKIKDYYEGVEVGILDDFQHLHDQERFWWGKSGLSEEGLDRARLIANDYGLEFNF